MSDVLVEELNYQIAKIDDEIARLKSWGMNASQVADLQRRRDQHYERLCRIDGLTPDLDS